MFFIRLCIPVILYILIFAVGFVYHAIYGNTFIEYLKENIFVVCWGAVLAILCQLGYTLTTWIIFLCPLIIMLIRYRKTGKLELSDKILTMPTKKRKSKIQTNTPTP